MVRDTVTNTTLANALNANMEVLAKLFASRVDMTLIDAMRLGYLLQKASKAMSEATQLVERAYEQHG